MQKANRIYNRLLLGEQKKTRRGKECQLLDVVIHSAIAKAQLTTIFFLKFPSLPSKINRWCNVIKRRNNKDGFHVFSSTVLCQHHFMKTY